MRAWVGTTGISRRSCLIYAICRDASRDYRSACILPTENRFDSRNSAAVSFRFALSILSSISFPRASLSYWRGTREVRAIRLLLNPSTSNSYPLPLEKYATVLSACHFFFLLSAISHISQREFENFFFTSLTGIRNR